MKIDIFKLVDDVKNRPNGDIAVCSECGWRGPISECNVVQDGDWESGYYEVHECPVCMDGGCIDDYDYSPEQAKKLDAWFNKQKANLQ
jgi:hypothetical protein